MYNGCHTAEEAGAGAKSKAEKKPEAKTVAPSKADTGKSGETHRPK
jgi:hypothetical protein